MRWHVRRQSLLIIDIFLVALATLFSLHLRENFDVPAERLQNFLPYLSATLASATVILLLSGVNRSIWRFTAMADYLRVVAAVTAIVVASLSIHFFLYRMEGVPRALPVIQAMLMAILLVGARVAIRLRHGSRHQPELPAPALTGASENAILVVGINILTELFLRSAAEFAPGSTIAGIVGRSEQHRGRRLHHYQVLGVPEKIVEILNTLEVHGVYVNRIVVTVAFSDLTVVVQQALRDIERKSDVRLDFLAEQFGFDDSLSRAGGQTAPACEAASQPTLKFTKAELQSSTHRPYFAVKRGIDFTVAALVVIVALPVIVLVGLVAALDVGAPIIFWQRRPGMHGRPFKLYKFRTMRGAHDRMGVRIPDSERLSVIGIFLRRTRLDELPQLYNIICGEMSFVGPRPLLPVDQSNEFASRLLVRPGMTGWAQVAGGRDLSASDKAVLDIWYVRNAGFGVDLSVLARTVPMIVFGERPDLRTLRAAWEELGVYKPRHEVT